MTAQAQEGQQSVTESSDDSVRYCPECGLIGAVKPPAATCCPDSFGMNVRRWQAQKLEQMLNRLRRRTLPAGVAASPGQMQVQIGRLRAALLNCIAALERTQHVDEAGRIAAADDARAALSTISADAQGKQP